MIIYHFFYPLKELIIVLGKKSFIRLEVLAQLTNVEIARPDVMTWVRTRDLLCLSLILGDYHFN